jgi:hypothetical protein
MLGHGVLANGDAWYFALFSQIFSSHPCNFLLFLAGNLNIFSAMVFLKIKDD